MANGEKTSSKFNFSWLIENYYSLYISNEESSSPKILAENLDNSEWYIRLVPEHNKEQILCYLNRISKIADDEKFFIDYECKFSNAEGAVLKSEKGINCVFEKDFCLTIDMDQFSDQFQNLFLCFKLKSEQPRRLAVGCKVTTKINTKRYFFKWNVRNNSSVWWQVKKTIHLDSSRFEMELTKSDDLFTIFIYRLDERSSETVEGKISVSNSHGVTFGTKTAKHNFSGGVWEFPNFISFPNLKSQGVPILPNETFVLACEFTSCDFSGPEELVKYTYDSQSNLPAEKESFVVLVEDKQHLLSVNSHWDVVLQVENKNMPAHKHILSKHSPVFSAMFEHDMLENQRGIVTIPNIDVETMKLFLNFIYCERVECFNYDSCVKLFLVADKYQALSLIEKCVDYLMSVLGESNVCEVLVMADIYGYDQLKENALIYLVENYERIVIEPEWLLWLETNKKFSADILLKLGSKLMKIKTLGEKERMTKKLKDSEEILYDFVSSLLRCGADPNISFKYDDTLLGIVCSLGLNRIALLLLESGARPTYYDLVSCFQIGDLKVIEGLLQRGAPTSCRPNLCESSLHCLSSIVSREKTISICKLLVKYGAEVDFENECYNTPLFFAVDSNDAEAIAALLHYGGQPCYKCPRGSPLERSFHLPTQVVQNLVKYAALHVNHALDQEVYNFFQYFRQEKRDHDLLSGKPYLKFAQQCMAEINVLKKGKIDRVESSLFDFATSLGETLKSYHDDSTVIRKVKELLNTPNISIYRDVIEKKLNKNYLI